MTNHPNRKACYKVRPIPGSSDHEGEVHFAVIGPDVGFFARQHELAKTMQRALNTAGMTPRERKVIHSALSAALAGEWSAGDFCWTEADADAAKSVLDRL
jgi:hypothetical protein